MWKVYFINYDKPIYSNGKIVGNEVDYIEIEAESPYEAKERAKDMGYDVFEN